MIKVPFNGDVRITNPFSKYHRGLDYGIANRTAIIATASGKVIKVEQDISKKTKKGVRSWIANTQNDPFKIQAGRVLIIRNLKTEDYGNYVKIDHGNKISTLYAHLDETVVNVGQYVKEGQLIGYSDSTGNSTGGHLHYEIRRNDVVIDPNTFDYSFKGMLEGGVEIKLYPLETTVEIVVPALYVRHGPSRGEALAGSREIKKGDIIDVVGFVDGEDVEGNKFWYKSAKGNYFWAGGTNKPRPELTLDGQKKNMTSVEKEARLVELENMKAALDARKAELEAALAENQAGYVEYDNQVAAFESEPVVDDVVETVVEAPVEEVVAEEVVETPEDVAQRNKLEEMYAWLKETLGK